MLELLLPTFNSDREAAVAVDPLDCAVDRQSPPGRPEEADDDAEKAWSADGLHRTGGQERMIAGEERRLLQNIVDFGDSLVREVMTPRPDIVAIREEATIGDLRALFREQEYSRFPVYSGSLDNIAGFVFVKDLVAARFRRQQRPITPLLRAAVIVPESKRVPELLKQFQRQQTQMRHRRRRVRRHGRSGHHRRPARGDRRRDSRRIRCRVRADRRRRTAAGSSSTARSTSTRSTQRLDVHIEREGFETVGGYLLTHLGRVPAVGERFDLDGLGVEVLEVERPADQQGAAHPSRRGQTPVGGHVG